MYKIPFKQYTFTTFHLPLISNFVLLMAVFMVCRLLFMLENWETFTGVTPAELKNLLRAGLLFDCSAICYVNMLYLFLQCCPFHYKETDSFQMLMKWIFILLNGIAVTFSLLDTATFGYIGKHFTADIFTIFPYRITTDEWIWGILKHCYLLPIGALLVWFIYRFYRKPLPLPIEHIQRYYIIGSIQCVILCFFIVCGIRGSISPSTHPLNQITAFDYASKPLHASLALNAPFTICRTLGKRPYRIPKQAEREHVAYSPIHKGYQGRTDNRTNIIIILLEDIQCSHLQAESTPTLHRLTKEGMTFRQCYANGMKGTDTQAAVLCGLPMFIESVTTSHAAMNNMSSLAHELQSKSYLPYLLYHTPTKSDGFLKRCGFNQSHSWDKMENMQEPFVALSTIKETNAKATDAQLQLFLKYAAQQRWYSHTLFVVVGDPDEEEKEIQSLPLWERLQIPLILFHPSDKKIRGIQEIVAQQTDVLPTVLGYLHYDKPHFAFGNNLLAIHPKTSFAANYSNGIFQYIQGHFVLQTDGKVPLALYDLNESKHPKTNQLHQRFPLLQREMEERLYALLQEYMTRMNENRLTIHD